MNPQQRTIVKLYAWKALCRLILDDLAQKTGRMEIKGRFHYIGGVDREGNPFLRVDITPLEVPRRDDDSKLGE